MIERQAQEEDESCWRRAVGQWLIMLCLGSLFNIPVHVGAGEPTSEHHHDNGKPSAGASPHQTVETCRLPLSMGSALADPTRSTRGHAFFEGVQIEASDMKLYEEFFEMILPAEKVQSMDHPQKDLLRGYCYRGVLIVVRQDLATPRPTGWVQINYAVPDVAAIQTELQDAINGSPFAKREDAQRNQVVRLRLKPDVRRGACRADRLEVGGPEGFMMGFDQLKEGSCREPGSSSKDASGVTGSP